MLLDEDDIASPCIRSCCLDEEDICLGCFRHVEEIMEWSTATPERKREILAAADTRQEEKRNKQRRNTRD